MRKNARAVLVALSFILSALSLPAFAAVPGSMPALPRATTQQAAPPEQAAPVKPSQQPATPAQPKVEPPGIPMDTNLFRNIAARENPVVVFITTESRTSGQEGPSSPDEDFFRRFFGMPGAPQRPEIQRALGSGFIISADGEILTNNHVVEGAERIRVGLYGSNSKTYDAKVVGRDPLSDSALIKLENGPGNLPVATLGDSDQLEPGDWVMAIGNPFQLGHTVTVGVISFIGRPFATTEGRSQDMLQTDAAINPGNSGGPLINVKGEVVGINSAILSGEGAGGNIGIGFAIPINTVRALLPQLRQGKVVRGRLGVLVQTAAITDSEAKTLGLPSTKGAIVSQVQPDSPASRAGLQPGDVIVSFNGKQVESADQLTRLVTATKPGTSVPVEIYRNGQEQTLNATIEELQLEGATQGEGGPETGFGLNLSDLTPDVAQQLGLQPGTEGALVQGVQPGSPAAQAGLQRGDVILQINRQPVSSAQGAARLLRDLGPGQSAFVLLSRRGQRVFLTLRR